MVTLSEILLPRSTWGARLPKSRDTNFTTDGGFVIHYTTRNAQSFKHWPDCYTSWQRHQNFHMDTKGWQDLAYNFGVCIHGFAFEGRGWGAQNGANLPLNTSTISICVDVDADDTFDLAVPNTINLLIAEGVRRGVAPRIRGHFEVAPTYTPCPGANVKALIAEGKIHLPSQAPVVQPNPVTVTEPEDDPNPPADPDPQGRVALLGSPTTTIAQMQKWARAHGATDLFVSLAVLVWRDSLAAGVDPAVTYAIMAHESGWGRFGGVIDVSYFNWAGIKNPAGGGDFVPGAHYRFRSHAEGVRAVVQHVCAYAGVLIPEWEIVDPRYSAPNFGSVRLLPSTSWTWASDGAGHSERIAAKVEGLRAS